MLHSLPHLLVDDAVRAVALQGRGGVTLAELWPLVPRATDDACRSFIWAQLRVHPSISLACAGRTEAQTKQMTSAEAVQVRLTADTALRAWLYAPRDGEVELTKEMNEVLDVLASRGNVGIFQSTLTKIIGARAPSRGAPHPVPGCGIHVEP